MEVAKTVMKDKLHVYNKADKIVHLSGDKKLEEVSFFFLLTQDHIFDPKFF